jgi:hypothetical protein
MTPSATNLTTLVQAGATWEEVSRHLDALDSDGRIGEVRAMAGKLQARLWQICAGATPLTLDDVVPYSLPEGQTVILAGKNSLPLFNMFEKRFTRIEGKVIGYNFQTWSPLTGPGYFTAVPAEGRPKEVLFDYTQIPADVPDGWPALKPNSSGFSWFVYRNMHDYCRRVAKGVILGEATRLGKPMNSYFILARK